MFVSRYLRRTTFAVFLACSDWLAAQSGAPQPAIEIWYGDEQKFGDLGHTQPLVNVLGSLTPGDAFADVLYRVNRGKYQQLVRGPDLHRLAMPGEFNIEIDRSRLKPGENTVEIRALTRLGKSIKKTVTLNYTTGNTWPLPFEVDFTQVDNLQDVVEVLDGKWELTDDGVRTAEPYYDRQLAFGDDSWQDYELDAELIIHAHFPPIEGRNRAGAPYLSHAHTSFNLRWGGHPDDGFSPRRDWQNLGSLVALRADLATPQEGSYWWMHFGKGVPGRQAKRSIMTPEERYDIKPNERVHYRMRCETVGESTTRYSTKLWREGDAEPTDWQLQFTDTSEPLATGGVVFVVHHSDATLCRVSVTELP